MGVTFANTGNTPAYIDAIDLVVKPGLRARSAEENDPEVQASTRTTWLQPGMVGPRSTFNWTADYRLVWTPEEGTQYQMSLANAEPGFTSDVSVTGYVRLQNVFQERDELAWCWVDLLLASHNRRCFVPYSYAHRLNPATPPSP